MKTDEQGQILPVSLFGLALLCLSMLLVFNTSQLTSKKQRLNNAADAAAYSAAVYQSRMLNSIAYSNRAMVANQVFIGQMVSLENYLNYWNVKSRNLSALPGAGIVTGPINTAVQSMQAGTAVATGLAVQEALATNVYLAGAQFAIAEAGAAGPLATVEKVIKANDPDIEITNEGYLMLGRAGHYWAQNVEQKSEKEDLIRKAEMIQLSRDPFTKHRNYSKTIVPFVFKLYKAGATDLIWDENGQDINFRWDAIDVLSLQKKSGGGLFGSTKYIPIAGSKKYLSGDGSPDTCTAPLGVEPGFWTCYQRLGGDHRGAVFFGTEFENRSISAPGLRMDLQNYYELTDDVGPDPRFPVVVSVRYKKEKIKTSDQVAGIGSPGPGDPNTTLGAGVFYQESKPIGGEVEAVAKAEVYFRRPKERQRFKFGALDSKDEFSNVWNPYWGARLSNVTTERNALRLLKGVDL